MKQKGKEHCHTHYMKSEFHPSQNQTRIEQQQQQKNYRPISTEIQTFSIKYWQIKFNNISRTPYSVIGFIPGMQEW
jgi:hypothetical protein